MRLTDTDTDTRLVKPTRGPQPTNYHARKGPSRWTAMQRGEPTFCLGLFGELINDLNKKLGERDTLRADNY